MDITQDLAKEVLTVVKSTKDFVLDQAPDVARQIIAFETYSTVFFVFISVVLLVTSILTFFKAIGLEKENKHYSEIPFGLVLLSVFVFVGSVIGAINNTIALIKVVFAPKVFLIEYLTKVLR